MAKINADALAASALSRNRISDGVTLVAAFGRQKPEPFTRLLSELKSRCSGSAVSRRWIRLYRDEQVHATIVGLEGERRGRSVVQKNIRERLGGASKAPPMDLEGLTEFLKSFVGTLDLAVGGFQEMEVNPYDLKRKPYERSFDIRPDGLLVAMGWPMAGASFKPSVMDLRKRFEEFNIVHKYHIRPQDRDNDLFFVLGELDADKWKTASGGEREKVQETVDDLTAQCRRKLSEQRFVFSLSAHDFHIVRYKYTSLAEVLFAKPAPGVDAATLLSLYPDSACGPSTAESGGVLSASIR